MKITKRQLRRIIRESLADDPRMKPDFAAEWMRDAGDGTDVARDVEAAIAKYTGTNAGRMQWKMSRNDFYNMADGEVYPGISDTYYIGWAPADFEAVIAAVEG